MPDKNLPPTIPPPPDRFAEIPDFQKADHVPAHELPGFNGIRVLATYEKSEHRKGDPNQPNQDSSCVYPPLNFASVQDGIGGHPNGEFASAHVHNKLPTILADQYQKTRAEFQQHILSVRDIITRIHQDQLQRRSFAHPIQRDMYDVDVSATLELISRYPELAIKTYALTEAIKRVHEETKTSQGETTFCGALIHTLPDGTRIAIGTNVGDSCSFILHKDGRIERLTSEDSHIQTLLDSGDIDIEYIYRMEKLRDEQLFGRPLSAPQYEQLSAYEHRLLITQYALGGRAPAPPSVVAKILRPGDIVLLSSDRLTKGYHREFGDTSLERLKECDGDVIDLELLAKDAMHGATLEKRLNHLLKESGAWGQDDGCIIMMETPSAPKNTSRDWIPGHLQTRDLQPAMHLETMSGLDVVVSIEKRNDRKEDPHNMNQDNVVIANASNFFGVADGVSSRRAAEASLVVEQEFDDAFQEELARVRIDCANTSFLRANGDALVEQLRARRDIADTTARATFHRHLERFKELCFVEEPELGKKALALFDTVERLHADVSVTVEKTTLAGVLIHTSSNGKRYALTTSVGDSLIVLQRKDGSITQLVYEDSVTHENMDRGTINREELYRMMRSRESGLGSALGSMLADMQRTVTRVLGGRDATPDIRAVEVFPGDRLIACTDGIGKAFERKVKTLTRDEFMAVNDPLFHTEEFQRVAQTAQTPMELADILREYAANAGVKDDRAIVVVEIA